MILYNVTVQIESQIAEEWMGWMIQTHIPEVMETGLFLGYKVLEITNDTDPHPTFAFQYKCKSITDFNKYAELHAAKLQSAHKDRYEGKYVAIRTIMKILHEETYVSN